jgi:fucose permease
VPALISAVMIGLGHAPVFPLVAERLRNRGGYHAGFYNGSISIAVAAAVTTPWLLSYLAEAFGISSVMLVPSIASMVVLVLAVLIMLESRLMGGKRNDSVRGLTASDM